MLGHANFGLRDDSGGRCCSGDNIRVTVLSGISLRALALFDTPLPAEDYSLVHK